MIEQTWKPLEWKNIIIYQTNSDYTATYENLYKNGEVASLWQSEKGLAIFRLKGADTIFELSPNGKLMVKWNNLEEKLNLLKKLSNLLVPRAGEALEIKPLYQQVFRITYPTDTLKVYWCASLNCYNRFELNPYCPKDVVKEVQARFNRARKLLALVYGEPENPLHGTPFVLFFEPHVAFKRLLVPLLGEEKTKLLMKALGFNGYEPFAVYKF